jgi:hypothetical protein
MAQREVKILSLQSNTRATRTVKGSDSKHFLIRRIQRRLVTQFSIANDNKQIYQQCRTLPGSFM